MIDINKYEGCIADMKGYDLAILAEELLKEVKRMRKALHEITKTEFFSYLKDVHPNVFLTEILEEMKE